TALPTIRNGQGGRSCTCDLLVPNPDTSGLLTLHPGKWLPDLDSHQDKRLNRPPCYFDTTWQMALPTGFPPASFRLEDGCLMYSKRNDAGGNPVGSAIDTTWQWRCRQDSHLHRSVSNTCGIRLLNGTMQVGILSAAPLPGSVKVARRPVKPLVLVRVQVWQPFSGRNVSSRRPCSERGGRRCNSCHPDHFGWLAEQ